MSEEKPTLIQGLTLDQLRVIETRVSVQMVGQLLELEKDVSRLKQAVMDGVFDERSIVGDRTLHMEGMMRQIRESFGREGVELPPAPENLYF